MIRLPLIPLALCATLAGGLALTGCGDTQVRRTETDEVIDLSGYWNDTDSQKVASALVASMLEGSWDEDFAKANGGKKPVVMLGKVKNGTSDDGINTGTFLKDLRRALVKTGKADVVDEDKSQTREEIKDQMPNAEKGTEAGKETAADFLLKGEINSQNDQAGNRKVMFYTTDLELTLIKTRKVVWTDAKKIKKDVTNAKAKI